MLLHALGGRGFEKVEGHLLHELCFESCLVHLRRLQKLPWKLSSPYVLGEWYKHPLLRALAEDRQRQLLVRTSHSGLMLFESLHVASRHDERTKDVRAQVRGENGCGI